MIDGTSSDYWKLAALAHRRVYLRAHGPCAGDDMGERVCIILCRGLLLLRFFRKRAIVHKRLRFGLHLGISSRCLLHGAWHQPYSTERASTAFPWMALFSSACLRPHVRLGT